MRSGTGPFALVGVAILTGAAILAASPGAASAAAAKAWTVSPRQVITSP